MNKSFLQSMLAGPRGFEPLLSGSEGRRLNPDLATGPSRNLNINFLDKSFYAVGECGAGSSAWLERPADNRKVESSNLSRPTTDSPDPSLISINNHFLFLNSLTPSMSVTYSNPNSMSFFASSTFLATLQTYLSLSFLNIASSSCM